MTANQINVTEGSGKSVSTETLGGLDYQRIKVIDGTAGSTSVLAFVNNGTAVPVSIMGVARVSIMSNVNVIQAGTTITSVVGGYPEDSAHVTGDTGLFTLGVRNDTMSSVTSADGDYSPHSMGPIGEAIIANAPITKWVQGSTSVMYGVSVQAIAAQGSSIFTYITAIQVSNDSPNYSRVTVTGGLGSILGYTVAPATGGSNILFANGLKSGANSGISVSISGISSVYLTLTGFISKS